MSQNEKSVQQNSSLLNSCTQDADIPPYQLSGDETSESVVASFASASKANFLLTVTTIMKTVIGSGILALPYAVSKMGYLLALIVLVIIYLINQFSCSILLKSKNLSKHSNYTSISYHLFKNSIFMALISLCILINNLGICIVQLEIFKETTVKLLADFITDPESQYIFDEFYTSKYFIVMVFAIMLSFFTVVKKIQKLKFMAFFGVTGIVIFIIALIINFFVELSQNDWDVYYEMEPFPRKWGQAIAVLPTIMLALAFQMNFFPIFKGMRNSNDQKMAKASAVGLGACTLFYLIVGNIGYALNGYGVQANFLKSLKKDDLELPLFIAMNAGFLVSVFFSFPVMFFGARNNFIALMKMIALRNTRANMRSIHADNVEQISSYIQAGSRDQKKRRANILFYVYTFFLFGVAIGVTMLVESIEQVFTIVGAIASNSIGFLFPCLFYFCSVNRKKKEKTFIYWLSLVIFVIFIPLGITAIIFQFV